MTQNQNPAVFTANLGGEQTAYLEKLMERYAPDAPNNRIAVRAEDGTGGYGFVCDAYVGFGDRREFSREAPAGLWLSGATGALRTRDGILAIFDDRLKGFKPVPMGWANFSDGPDLRATVLRELEEEIAIFLRNRECRYVPEGGTAMLEVPCLGIPSLGEARVHGALDFLRYNTKTINGERALVAHFGWDLRELPDDITIVYDDEWHQGGHFGAPVVVIDPGSGHMVGYYAGQQGLVRPDDCVLDPDLAMILERAAVTGQARA